MKPMKVSSANVKAPQCTFTHPGETRRKFLYHESPEGSEHEWTFDSSWNTESSNPLISLYGFKHWDCKIGGVRYTLRENEAFGINTFNLDSPIITMTARWQRAYDVISFLVDGNKYCEVCIDVNVNRVVYPPHDPEIKNNDEDEEWRFYGWDCSEGDYLPGVDRSSMVICGENETPIFCEDGPIICKEDDIDYSDPINAYLVNHVTQKFKVTFKYMDTNGKPVEHNQYVVQNYHLPRFHIHDNHYTTTVDEVDHTFTFRYWRLESGNLTSSATVLTDLVFVAAYDEVVDSGRSDTKSDENGQGTSQTPETQTPVDDLPNCGHCKPYDEGGHTHGFYCTLQGLDPLRYEPYFDELDTFTDKPNLSECPYVKALRLLYGDGNARTGKSKENDLKQTTIIDIEDIANLLKALFKVNIDIAHREYFLKIDIPEESNWWYGYQDGEEWISFEPMVELKFSNLHSDNQLNEEGNLICTVKSRSDTPVIVPVNRELSYSYGKNVSVQYNEFNYFYDYKKSLQSVGERDIDSSKSRLIDVTPELDDQQNFYEIKPLCLYENTQLQSPTDVNDFVKRRLHEIGRSVKQVKTFTSFVKKYRPVIMPNVRHIFNDCDVASPTKYEADINNNYGVFGWCTIPSKTMVNMEYNEGALYVPSSYDHHNHVSGSNFLQMDNDFKKVYRKFVIDHLDDNARNTWVWLYNTRDWTYFIKPFFDVGRNNEVYSGQLDEFPVDLRPENSNHLNGVVFEKNTSGRSDDISFLGIASTCQFLARYHHNENNLKVLSERYTNLLSYQELKKLTSNSDDFNNVYGSEYPTQE